MPLSMAPRDPGKGRGTDTDEEEVKGPQNAVAEAVLYPQQQMSMAQLENALAEQQRELHMLVAHHYETARQMLVSRDQMAMACQIENQELRAQIGELRKQTTTSTKRQRDQALLARQHVQANKVLLKRDLQARKTEQENAELRSTLAHLKANPPRAPAMLDDEFTEHCGSDDNSPITRSQVSAVRPRSSEERMPEFSAQPSTRPYTAHAAKRDSGATGVNLLMALKLPGQVYDEGNFFPKEDSSDSEDHDLPPWDAELTKRPKRAVAVMDMKERMRQMFKTQQVKLGDIYKSEGWCSKIASHPNFETIVYAFIVANVIWLGIDAVVNQEVSHFPSKGKPQSQQTPEAVIVQTDQF